jgi:hypothetical protein
MNRENKMSHFDTLKALLAFVLMIAAPASLARTRAECVDAGMKVRGISPKMQNLQFPGSFASASVRDLYEQCYDNTDYISPVPTLMKTSEVQPNQEPEVTEGTREI